MAPKVAKKKTILDEVYRTAQDVKDVFLMAREEVDQTGQVSPEVQEAINSVCLDRNAVATDLGDWYMRTECELEGLEAQYKPIMDRIRADLAELGKRLEFIKWCVKQVLPPAPDSQLANDRAYIYYRTSKVIVIEDEAAIPLEFKEVITVPKKADIKTCIESGGQVPGARQDTNYSPQIKPGGVKAIRAAQNRMKKVMAGRESDAD